MDDTIITTYCLCEEFSEAMGLRDDPQVVMTNAEVMCVAVVAAAFFGGNIEETRLFLHEYGYMKGMLSKSRLNRRLHSIEPDLWQALFAMLAEIFKERNADGAYVVDSLPVAVCDNIRIKRCVGSILRKPRARAFAAISRANAAISTVCGCIWW
jgi:hypothetical protein